MLRVPRTRKATTNLSVCWSCLAGGVKTAWGRDVILRGPFILAAQYHDSLKTINAPKNGYATSDSSKVLPTKSFQHVEPRNQYAHSKLRSQLQDWEMQNIDIYALPPDVSPLAIPGTIRNNMTRQTSDETEIDQGDDLWNVGSMDISGKQDDRLDVGSKRSFLRIGDLVDLGGSATQRHELAVFVKEYDRQLQFYTASGRWVHLSLKHVQFFVPEFATPEEVEELCPYLPQAEVSVELQDKLHSFDVTVPRSVGKELIARMLRFSTASDGVYRDAAFKLDNAHTHLALEEPYTYATLDEIAANLLKHQVKKSRNGRFSDAALYAVHRALSTNDIGFRCLSRGEHRKGALYEISPKSETRNIRRVTEDVREYIARCVDGTQAAKFDRRTKLEEFVEKAQRLIDQSRETRDFTPFGMIGPYKGSSENDIDARQTDNFTSNDLAFIEYIESWAGFRTFGLSSSQNGIGSIILRAMGRYPDLKLDRTTAWTFLQEIGVIPPWEDPGAYILRLPKTGRRLQNVGPGTQLWRPDILEKHRTYLTETVYCIDDVGAHELDDAVSIEPTEIVDQYWIHIHTADPSSRIDPNSNIAQTAKSLAQTAYLPGKIYPMLPNLFVQANLSLRKNAPSLTFSARMNTDGVILETKVTPSILQKVVYLTPNTLDEVLNGPNVPEPRITVDVGAEPLDQSTPRKMKSIDELSNNDRENLRTLHKLGQAHASRRAARGALSSKRLDSSVSAALIGAQGPLPPSSSHTYRSDPKIKVVAAQEDTDMTHRPRAETVQYLMIIGGETAARWCHERGIPVPYRLTPKNDNLRDPQEYFRTVVLPSLDKHGNAPAAIATEYYRLCGSVVTSSEPGPHMTTGLEMYARCTSPLRRFGDLLVHWQVEATILEEVKTGKSLVGNTRDDFLPFTKSAMDEILPSLSAQEKLSRMGMEFSQRSWLCQLLVRAWHFKQFSLPETLNFVVTHVSPAGYIMGTLPFFRARSICFGPFPDKVPSFKLGDELEVKIESVDVYEGQIRVEAVNQSGAQIQEELSEV